MVHRSTEKGEGNMDWFEKNPIENKEIPVTEYVRYLASFDARKIFWSLGKINAWSNSVDYIGGSYTSEWELKKMVIGIYYGYEGKYHIETLTKQKYLAILAELRNSYAAEHPEHTEMEEEYQKYLAKFEQFSKHYE